MALTISPDAHDFLGQTYGITGNQAVIDMREEIREFDVPPWSPWLGLLLHPDFGGSDVAPVLAIADLWRDTWQPGDERRLMWLLSLYRPMRFESHLTAITAYQ